MSPWLGGLAYDVLYGICQWLDIEDVVNLHNSSRHLRFILQEETLARMLLEERGSPTLEAKEAAQTKQYSAAVRRIFKRRLALAKGQPALVRSLGYAADADFRDGEVCLLESLQVRILDLYGSRGQVTIPIRSLLGCHAMEGVRHDWDCIQILNYSKGTLIFKYTDDGCNAWLMAVDISQPRKPKQLISPERLQSTAKLFALQDRDRVFFGTRSATATWCNQPYREWLIQGIALRGKQFSIVKDDGSISFSHKSEKIQLHGFAGGEIGTSAAFRLHDGHLYAVTNYDAFDVIEVDFTSYYHCIRFPVDIASQASCQAARTIFRRQHADGPVNDSWNKLELQVDERTNELLIIEGRAEWPFGGGDLSRGFYAHKLNMDDQGLEPVQSRHLIRGPVEDPLSRIPDRETKYCPTPELPVWQAHLEVDNQRVNPGIGPIPSLARSKSRSYNFTTMTSLELVEVPCHCRGVDVGCLQLRSFSRRLIPLLEEPSGKGKSKTANGLVGIGSISTPTCKYSPVSFWPVADNVLHQTMNLPIQMHNGRNVEVKAWMDERSLVYFVSSGGFGKVVCISFDGDAPVRDFPDVTESGPLLASRKPRGRRLQSEPEHVRYISPVRDAWDQARYDPHEVNAVVLESTWDLEGIPNAEQLDMQELELWFDSFGSSPENNEMVV